MENHSAEWVKEAMENAERTKMNLERCKYGKEKPNCSECDFKPWIKPICQRLLCSVALELITSQEQRIKELTEENENLHASCTELTQECKKWQGRLKIECKYTEKITIKKMHAEIARRCIEGGIYPAFVESTIDQIVKELTEDGH